MDLSVHAFAWIGGDGILRINVQTDSDSGTIEERCILDSDMGSHLEVESKQMIPCKEKYAPFTTSLSFFLSFFLFFFLFQWSATNGFWLLTTK